MFSKTVKIKNGDSFSLINYYKCDITGEEFCESDGWYGNNKTHITPEGMEILIEKWIERNSHYCGYPIILHYLIQRLCKKIRRDTHIPKELKNLVLETYKHTCQHCGTKENLTFDHIHPVSKGGLTEFINLQILCKSCNSKKGAKI